VAATTHLTYARQRIRAFISQIDRVGQSEFPYRDSEAALVALRTHFVEILRRLDGLDEQTLPEIAKQECAIALVALFDYLPLLGIVLRSTNVRNAFEAFRPFKRLSAELLERRTPSEARRTKLLLSSEWNYAPLTYHGLHGLPHFVLIGLPAPESANPLVLPLAGHELGHSVWRVEKIDKELQPLAKRYVLSAIRNDWNRYHQVFPWTGSPEDLGTNIFAIETWEGALQWCLMHAKETFCDFIGLRLFGEAFLHAFAYLLAPRLTQRAPGYPASLSRAQHLLYAAKQYGIPAPDGYDALFEDEPVSGLTEGDQYRLAIAEKALTQLIAEIVTQADESIAYSKVKLPDEVKIATIHACIRKLIPAENSESVSNILNAAWRAFHDPTLWREGGLDTVIDRDRVLKELVLKNLELLDIEAILRTPAGPAASHNA
jgi:hypothetical protein